MSYTERIIEALSAIFDQHGVSLVSDISDAKARAYQQAQVEHPASSCPQTMARITGIGAQHWYKLKNKR